MEQIFQFANGTGERFAARLILLPRGYFFCCESFGPPYRLFSKKQKIKTRQFYAYEERLLFR